MSNKNYLPCPEDENPFPDLDEDEYDDEEYARNLGDISELPAESGILGVDNISSVTDRLGSFSPLEGYSRVNNTSQLL